SGGMRQRVMIAIALASSPRLLLADEPTTALDVTIQDQIIKLLMQLKKEFNMSMILVTHDMGVASQMCDRIAVMYAGYIMEMSDIHEIFLRPRHPYTYGLMSSLPVRGKKGAKLNSIQGAPPNLYDMPQGCPFHPRCRFCQDLCRKSFPPLSEIAEGHVSRCHYIEQMTDVKGIVEERTSERKGES
ncbi:MAG: ABC transporter ATP-binding protein, partial [Lachnospiraceae bacterium]